MTAELDTIRIEMKWVGGWSAGRNGGLFKHDFNRFGFGFSDGRWFFRGVHRQDIDGTLVGFRS